MIRDFKFALRNLVKTPAFAAIAIVTLALGIGANSAIFSVIDTVLLRPLPFKNPQQLAAVWIRDSHDKDPKQRGVFSVPDFVDLREQNQSFAAMTAYTRAATVVSLGDDSQQLEGVAITSDVFNTLGVTPVLGRAYTPEEDKIEAPPVVVISHELWRRVFGGDRNIIGRQVTMAARSYTVIGVMPPAFKFPLDSDRLDYVMPLAPVVGKSMINRGAHFLTVVARLKAGVSVRQAEAETTTILARLAKQYPDTNTTVDATTVMSLHEDLVWDVQTALVVLLGAVALVLMIACANVANLLLARGASRMREMAIRTALGASRSRIVRQLLCESLLLALIGGIGGLLLAWWGVDLLGSFGPRDVPRLNEISVNENVCVFTFVLALGSTLIFGLAPALQISRGSVNESLQQGSKGSTGGLHSNRLRASLVVSQVAVSLLLLTGAGLLLKSFFNLQHTRLGFTPERVITTGISLPRIKYSEPNVQVGTLDRVVDKIAAVPGVESLGGINPLPLSGNTRTSTLTVSGAPPLARGQHPDAGHLIVAGDYFRAMQIRLLSGRYFDRRDTKDAPLVVIINEAFAKKFLPGRDPLGQHVMIDRPDDKAPPCEVIGVVANSRHDSISQEPGPEFYCPLSQDPDRHLDIVFRTAVANLSGLHSAVNTAVHAVDRDIYVPELRPMNSYIQGRLAPARFNMLLLVVFAGTAVVLAAIGIYGVIAYSVTQRTREIGIRIALGAQRTQMLALILRQSLTLIGGGIVIGVVAAFAATRLLQSLLYGVQANDLLTYACVVVLLGGAATLASYLPARRAMRVDPMVALRYE
ncbi:MAG: ABC transporter permease [Chthoniobacterales bacterium]